MDDILALGKDTDGDGLTDSQEVNTYGCSPLSLDTDGDTMSDWDEVMVYSTSPTNSDTDADGMNDGWEAYIQGDPTANDFSNGVVSAQIDILPCQTNSALGTWVEGTNYSIQALSRRGYVEYNFTVATPDIYTVRVGGGQGRDPSLGTSFELLGYIDGEYLGFSSLDTTTDSRAWFIGPWLTNGTHTLRLYWNNVYHSTSLVITDIALLAYAGADANSNGIKDWVECRLNNTCSLDPVTNACASPVCIEGKDAYLSKMALSGTDAQIRHGAGKRWYANVPLSATNATSVVVSFQDGAKAVTNSISWQETNPILSTNALTIRKDDSLLLTAHPAGATNGTVQIQIVGVTNYTTSVDSPVPHLFATNGNFTVIGTYSNETVTCGTTLVSVISGSFPTNPPAVCIASTRTCYECPNLPYTPCSLENDADVQLTGVANFSGHYAFNLGVTDVNDSHYLVGRLKNGTQAIVDNLKINTLWAQIGTDGYCYLVETKADGTQVIQDRINVANLPAGATVRLHIFVAGCTFENGTTDLTVTPDEFNALGEFWYRMLIAPGYSATCHTFTVYDGNKKILDK